MTPLLLTAGVIPVGSGHMTLTKQVRNSFQDKNHNYVEIKIKFTWGKKYRNMYTQGIIEWECVAINLTKLQSSPENSVTTEYLNIRVQEMKNTFISVQIVWKQVMKIFLKQQILFNKNVLFVITIKHNWKCPEELCTAVSNGKHPQSAWYKEGANSHLEGLGQGSHWTVQQRNKLQYGSFGLCNHSCHSGIRNTWSLSVLPELGVYYTN